MTPMQKLDREAFILPGPDCCAGFGLYANKLFIGQVRERIAQLIRRRGVGFGGKRTGEINNCIARE